MRCVGNAVVVLSTTKRLVRTVNKREAKDRMAWAALTSTPSVGDEIRGVKR